MFAALVRSMKLDELQAELQETERQLTLLIQKYQAMVDEMERSGSVELDIFSVGTAAEADKVKKQIDGLRDRGKILQEAIGDLKKAKVEIPQVTETEATT